MLGQEVRGPGGQGVSLRDSSDTGHSSGALLSALEELKLYLTLEVLKLLSTLEILKCYLLSI